MRRIKYGFFGEDNAQKLFLRHYLVKVAAGQPFRFEEDATFPLVGGTKDKVKAQFSEACDTGLSRYQQDCFFVGLDLDDHRMEAFEHTVRGMQQKLATRGVSAILLVPMQCIEHWLRYLQWREQNPTSTKNVTLETEERKQAKIALYGGAKVSTRHSNPIVERIAGELDIDWLASRSTSFLAFHNQVMVFLAALPPIKP
jgi:hypothetical protein